VLDGAAHLANVEQPAAFAEAALAHLKAASTE
jgi:pimeloyl-ACP methyl ester carboxylesterase